MTDAVARSDGQPEVPDCRFSVIIPCYNEENGILRTLDQLRAALEGAEPYELIVVDDGSTDRSAEILREANLGDLDLRLVQHEWNRGYGAALKTGLRKARAELIVIADADGTYPLDRILDLVEEAQDADMVVGSRTAENVEYPLIRKIPKLFLTRYASWMAGRRIPDMNSGLRVFRRSVAEKFLMVLPDGFSFTTTITLAMLTNHYDVRYVPIGYTARIGRSKIRPIRDTLNFVQLILRTAVYFAPMRVFGPVILLLMAAFVASASYDAFVLGNLADKTVILFMFTLNAAMFALLADMIDKRSSR